MDQDFEFQIFEQLGIITGYAYDRFVTSIPKVYVLDRKWKLLQRSKFVHAELPKIPDSKSTRICLCRWHFDLYFQRVNHKPPNKTLGEDFRWEATLWFHLTHMHAWDILGRLHRSIFLTK